jgi:hypothetical protein
MDNPWDADPVLKLDNPWDNDPIVGATPQPKNPPMPVPRPADLGIPIPPKRSDDFPGYTPPQPEPMATETPLTTVEPAATYDDFGHLLSSAPAAAPEAAPTGPGQLDDFGRPLGEKPEPAADVKPGLLSIAGQAIAKGIVKSATDTAKAASGQAFTRDAPENDDSEVGKLLKQDITQGWKDPAWWTARMAHMLGSGSPMFAGAALGGAAGSAIGPEGTLPGAAIGMGGMGMVQSLYPEYQAARQAGLDHDAAVKQAIDNSGIMGVGASIMGSAPAVSLFGKDAMGALKKPVGEGAGAVVRRRPQHHGRAEGRDERPRGQAGARGRAGGDADGRGAGPADRRRPCRGAGRARSRSAAAIDRRTDRRLSARRRHHEAGRSAAGPARPRGQSPLDRSRDTGRPSRRRGRTGTSGSRPRPAAPSGGSRPGRRCRRSCRKAQQNPETASPAAGRPEPESPISGTGPETEVPASATGPAPGGGRPGTYHRRPPARLWRDGG